MSAVNLELITLQNSVENENLDILSFLKSELQVAFDIDQVQE